MDLESNLIVVLLATLFSCSVITCQPLISHRYMSVKAADGSPLCTTENPSKVVAMSAGPVRYRCGKECTQCTTCLVHQMNEAKKQCQLFNFAPKNYTNVNQCKAYYTASDIDVRNALITTSSCSFPFTSNGTLFFSCQESVPSLCEAWCLNMYAQKVTCSKDEYVAQNVTVDVTVPILNTVATMMSIQRWLIIMSRFDSTFPVMQSYQVYQDGFGNLMTSNFWLGLTRVYYLTNSAVNGGHAYRMRVEALNTLQWYSVEYDWFYLEGPATDFTFRVTNGSSFGYDMFNDGGSNGKSLVNGIRFSPTGIPGYCPGTQGLWWYAGYGLCTNVNLFGISSAFNGGSLGALKAARIMIRLVQ